MATAWGGADPVAQSDANSYELGNEYLINAPLTISAVRLWGGPSDVSLANRKAHLWNAAGTLLGTANLPNTLTAGWATYPLQANVTRVAGDRLFVTYGTGGNYGALTNALGSAVNSSDGNVTCVAAANGTLGGNGVFNTTVGAFPNRTSSNSAFYGADFVYALGIAGPMIQSVTVTEAGLVATSTITATDTGAGVQNAVYQWQWGDGQTTSSGSNMASHTYSTAGVYPILASVTDVASQQAFAAAVADVQVVSTGLGFTAIVDSLVSYAQQLGVFASVNANEPFNPPGDGVTATVFLGAVRPIGKLSGLAATAASVVVNMRLYMPLSTQGPDRIDKQMTDALSKLMASLDGAFTLGGLVHSIDLLGRFGQSLDAKAGYIDWDSVKYRVITVSIPCLVDAAWAQVA